VILNSERIDPVVQAGLSNAQAPADIGVRELIQQVQQLLARRTLDRVRTDHLLVCALWGVLPES